MGDPAPNIRLEVGAIVADRYRIEALLGEGGMGIVYRAEHVHMRKRVALKVLLTEWSKMPEVVARFEREAIAAGKIEHPNVARATDFGRLADGSFFLVLEYVDGRTLREVIAKGALAPERALRIARGIGAAIGAAHAQGIVHRDLKPENVMLVEQGDDPDFVKVLDFGIAKVDGFGDSSNDPSALGPSSKPLTRVGSVIGTPDYMSPEQAFGEVIDPRSDLYSVGVMLFEMLAGKPPFRGDAVSVLRQHVTAPVPPLDPSTIAQLDPRADAVMRCLLEKEPAARFQSARDFVMALDELVVPNASTVVGVSGVRPQMHSVSGVTTPSPRNAITSSLVALRRHASPRTLIAAGAVGALFLVAGVVVVAQPTARPLVARSVELPSQPFLDEIDDAQSAAAPVLPPPPAATTASASATASTTATATGPARGTTPTRQSAPPPKAQGRHTGPGGIYIPPPSQWFK